MSDVARSDAAMSDAAMSDAVKSDAVKSDAKGSGAMGGGPPARPSRGGLAPSEAVGRLVEGCRRRATLAHAARALCGAIAASLATLALVAAGGRPWGDPEGLSLIHI